MEWIKTKKNINKNETERLNLLSDKYSERLLLLRQSLNSIHVKSMPTDRLSREYMRLYKLSLALKESHDSELQEETFGVLHKSKLFKFSFLPTVVFEGVAQIDYLLRLLENIFYSSGDFFAMDHKMSIINIVVGAVFLHFQLRAYDISKQKVRNTEGVMADEYNNLLDLIGGLKDKLVTEMLNRKVGDNSIDIDNILANLKPVNDN